MLFYIDICIEEEEEEEEGYYEIVVECKWNVALGSVKRAKRKQVRELGRGVFCLEEEAEEEVKNNCKTEGKTGRGRNDVQMHPDLQGLQPADRVRGQATLLAAECPGGDPAVLEVTRGAAARRESHTGFAEELLPAAPPAEAGPQRQ